MSEEKYRSLRYLGLTTALALGYFTGAELGLSLASVHTNVSPVWPQTGIGLASLLFFGRRVWPAIFLGAFAANLWTGVSIVTAGGIASGNRDYREPAPGQPGRCVLALDSAGY